MIAHFDPFSGPPRLHGARRVGIRPGTDLIHPIAVSGQRPLTWEVDGLPHTVTVDGEGILRGTAPVTPGDRSLRVRVLNALGAIEATIDLCVGDQLLLTPPMGWNSWNLYGKEVSAAVVLEVAEAMATNGMRDIGYQYVNIDDHWHADARHPDGTPAANPQTFPDGIRDVAARVHELGLKLGIYSDAAELTCGNCFGGYGYEEIDARTYAAWGVDLLKYDYCHAPWRAEAARDRYGVMGRALAASGRSIVFSACEWGLRKPWTWAPDVGASMWRTTGDIYDTFSRGPLGVRGIARRNLRLAEFAGPGRWNDPDMLLVGNHGRGRSTGVVRVPVMGRKWLPKVWSFRGLDAAQPQSHVTLWAMMAAPLFASHDLSSTGERDLKLLTNPDVLDVNQDPLGRQATRVDVARGIWVLAKPLADGGVAVSVTNLGQRAREMTVDLTELGHDEPLEVTDAWALEALGVESRIRVNLGRHASAMFVCRPPGPDVEPDAPRIRAKDPR